MEVDWEAWLMRLAEPGGLEAEAFEMYSDLVRLGSEPEEAAIEVAEDLGLG